MNRLSRLFLFLIGTVFIYSCASNADGLSFDLNGYHYNVPNHESYYYTNEFGPRFVISYSHEHFVFTIMTSKLTQGTIGMEDVYTPTNGHYCSIWFYISANVPVGGNYYINYDAHGSDHQLEIVKFTTSEFEAFFSVKIVSEDGTQHLHITNGHIKAHL